MRALIRKPDIHPRLVVGFVLEAAAHTGQLRVELARLGKKIGPYDQMIAGHANSQGLIVVTNNRREFDRVPGLRIGSSQSRNRGTHDGY